MSVGRRGGKGGKGKGREEVRTGENQEERIILASSFMSTT